MLNYEVPRCKQYNRSGKNESEHGTDVLACTDFLLALKSRTKTMNLSNRSKSTSFFKGSQQSNKDAVGDSKKDEHRFSPYFGLLQEKLRSMGKISESEHSEISAKNRESIQNTLCGELPYQVCRLSKRTLLSALKEPIWN